MLPIPERLYHKQTLGTGRITPGALDEQSVFVFNEAANRPRCAPCQR